MQNKYFLYLAGILIFVVVVAGIVIGINTLQGNTAKQDEGKQDVKVPLEANLRVDKFETPAAITYLSLATNKEITVENSKRVTAITSEVKDNKYYYALEVKNLDNGNNNVAFTVKDEDGFTKDLSIAIYRRRVTLPRGKTAIENWPDTHFVVDGDNPLVLLNKKNRLTDDYAPQDLVDLNKEYLLYTNIAGIMLKREAADALKTMLADLKNDTGKNVVIASGYRSISEQFDVYTGWLSKLGETEADKISARPGYSEHHLATVVDFINQESGLELTNKFDDTSSGKWLKANAYKYGFVQSYPKGSESITGYSYEAWHYRYIGPENAKEMVEKGMVLTNYLLEKQSK